MRRKTNRATKETQNTETVAAKAAEAEAAKAEAFDAEADAAAAAAFDPFYAEFTVSCAPVLNSPELEEHGEVFDVTVIRSKKGSYTATFGEHTGKLSRKPDVAVRAVLKLAGMQEKRVNFDAEAAQAEQAPLPEAAGGNQPEAYFFDEEGEATARLRDVEADVLAADKLLQGAAADTRKGWLGFGTAYNTAKAIFAEAGFVVEGGNSDEAQRGKTAWGSWLRKRFGDNDNVAAILAKKNAAGQAGFFATAPDDVVEAVGVNTASTFERKVNEAVTEFAASVASAVHATLSSNGDEIPADLPVDQHQSNASDKLEAREATHAKSFAAWQKEAEAAAKKGKQPKPFADAKKGAPLQVVRWLTDTAVPFDGSKLHKSLQKAWEKEVNQPSEEEKAEEAAEKATSAIVKTFADMDVEDAAVHLLRILVAHDEPEQVLEALGDRLVDWQTAEAAKAEQAKAAAESEAA